MNRELTQPGAARARKRRFSNGRTGDAGAAAALEESYQVLRDDEDRFVDEILETVREQVREMDGVASDALRRFIRADCHRALKAVSEGRGPTRDELDASGADAAAFARAGLTLAAVTAARRVAVRRMWELLCDLGTARMLEQNAQVECLYAIWEWADAVQASDSEVHRRTELELAGGGDERVWFVRALLYGTLPPSDLRNRATAYGLLPGGHYIPLRARPAPGVDARALLRAIERTGGEDGIGVLLASVDGDICGVTSRAPAVEGEGIVGLGVPAELTRLDRSFRLATRALETAVAFGLDGVVTIDELSLRPAILAEGHLGERLVRRYLDPLLELGEFGATLETTVAAYLTHGMRIDESAKALFVHPNTLRHRLDRFQQLTGADLRDTEDLVGLWWALERRRLEAS